MKKKLLILCCIAAVMSSCSSKTETDSAADTSEQTSQAVSDTSSDASSEDESEEDLSSLPQRKKVEVKYLHEVGEYAKNFSNRILNDPFSADITVTTASGASNTSHLSIDGYRAYVKMKVSGADLEIYFIDGKTYSLLPAVKSVLKPKTEPDITSITLDAYALDSRAVLKSTEEKDGKITEVYGVPAAAKTPDDYELNDKIDLTVTYYFDKQTGNAFKLTVDSPLTGMNTVTIDNLEFGSQKITLPNIKGWPEIVEGEEIDGKSKLRMTMNALGITDEMITKSGYSFDQIAAMSNDEMSEALAKIMSKNGLK